MSEELQNDSLESDINPEVIEDHQNDEVELATTSEGEHEQNTQVDEEAAKQEAINKAINKKHFETKQAERDLQAANTRIAEFEQAQREQMAAQVGNIPEMPDAFDDDYEAKMADRDAAIVRQAEFNHAQNAYNNQQVAAQQQAQTAQAQELQVTFTKYQERTKELGIDPNELKAAGDAIMNYGISDGLTMHIVADSDGPLITKYLAANPSELALLSGMNDFQAAIHIESVKAKAAALKPKTSSAPAPAQNLSGNGVDPNSGKYQNIKGATFS